MQIYSFKYPQKSLLYAGNQLKKLGNQSTKSKRTVHMTVIENRLKSQNVLNI